MDVMDTTCHHLDPEMVSRCGLDTDHVGPHENWYGTWWEGVWLSRFEMAR